MFISIFCHSICWGVGSAPYGSGGATLPQAATNATAKTAIIDAGKEVLFIMVL
jgi:hypothetical protein